MEKTDGGVNYIRHLLGISEKFIDDKRLSPLHISLYYALFQCWNLSKFRNPISVCRAELMQASKIGSANTYTKCLKELDAWEYIKYYPSHNPHKGSQVYLYNFNKTTDNATDISTNKSSNKTTAKTTGKSSVKAVIPSTNSINNTNKPNSKNKNGHNRTGNNKKSAVADNAGTRRKKVAQKKERTPQRVIPSGVEGKPTLKELQNYFTLRKWPAIEAEKFFNYFQSNGWLVGGKTPMKNWKAATKNWMLNTEKFNNSKTKSNGRVTSSGVERRSAGKLHTTTGKNYDEPL
jgi:hypothetical protein